MNTFWTKWNIWMNILLNVGRRERRDIKLVIDVHFHTKVKIPSPLEHVVANRPGFRALICGRPRSTKLLSWPTRQCTRARCERGTTGHGITIFSQRFQILQDHSDFRDRCQKISHCSKAIILKIIKNAEKSNATKIIAANRIFKERQE